MEMPVDADGNAILKGKKTGANDVGRMIESLESKVVGALRPDDIKKLREAYLDAYRAAYSKASGGVAIDEAQLQDAMVLYQIETELAALPKDKTAVARIFNLISKSEEKAP
jgi:hypothetical protein